MGHPIVILFLGLSFVTGCAHKSSIKSSNDVHQTRIRSHQLASAVTQNRPQSQSIDVFNHVTPIGRYSVMRAIPTIEQQNILTVMITVTMPKPIQTVGDAIRHLLIPSGYSLARFDAQGPEVLQLLNLPLPTVHRKLGPMPLQQALLTLASPAFRLHTDPVHRLIAYDLKPDYQLELVP